MRVQRLLADDYEVVPKHLFFAARCMRQPIVSAQVVIGQTIYTTRRKVDLILYHPSKWPNSLVIQCKWQSSTGTTDEAAVRGRVHKPWPVSDDHRFGRRRLP